MVVKGCKHDDPALGCTEAEALERFGRVLAAHAPEMAALGAFARSGSNRIVFVPAPGWRKQYPNEVNHYADGSTDDPSIASDLFWREADLWWMQIERPLFESNEPPCALQSSQSKLHRNSLIGKPLFSSGLSDMSDSV